MKKRIRRTRKREEIVEILNDFRRSGLSQAAFASKRELAVSTLQFWLRKERNGWRTPAKKTPRSSRQLIPVRIVEPQPTLGAALLEFEFSDGAKLRFSNGLSAEALALYAKALGHRC